jgi:hypothetical protein
LINIVGIPITRHETTVENLQATVEHPSACRTLGVTSQVLLEDTQNGIALLAAKMLHLLTNDI